MRRVLFCLAVAAYAQTPEVGGGPAIPAKGYYVAEIRGGVYWVTDGAYNTMFVVTETGVIAVDAPPTLGANYMKAIREVTSKPVTHLIYTHEHTDHIGGASLFPGPLQIIAQRETANLLEARKDPRRPAPNVVFDKSYSLVSGGQTIELAYPGPNHESGNVFVYAPGQKVLMLVDVVYPGFLPYKNLGIVQDVPGYIAIHEAALRYDFDTLVAGHVSRLGNPADVRLSLQLTRELYDTSMRAYGQLPFPAFLDSHPGRDKWDAHNEYEKALTESCVAEMSPRWSSRLADVQTYLKDDCWAMIEAIAVDTPPALFGK